MCGIVGLHLKNEALRPQLGALLVPMLVAMSERGPDSAGIAIYDDAPTTDAARNGALHYTLHSDTPAYDWEALANRLQPVLAGASAWRPVASDVVLSAPGDPAAVVQSLATAAPEVRLFSYGRALEVFKDVGDPAAICERYGIAARSGYQGLGHTRMATESAVTTEHSHPFAAAADLCLVHNGSFSNYASVRRDLMEDGVRFQTDNDSEVAARFLAREMARGAGMRDALHALMRAFDGFYTLLVASHDEFAVVRDAFACKPAVIAECDDYVAMASEYRALAQLPGVDEATVFEPMPEEIHVWSR